MVLFAEWLGYRRGDALYLTLACRWSRVIAGPALARSPASACSTSQTPPGHAGSASRAWSPSSS